MSLCLPSIRGIGLTELYMRKPSCQKEQKNRDFTSASTGSFFGCGDGWINCPLEDGSCVM